MNDLFWLSVFWGFLLGVFIGTDPFMNILAGVMATVALYNILFGKSNYILK